MGPALITVPIAIPMVSLVGSNDVYIRAIEKAFPELVITVRGNEIFAKGPTARVTQLEGLLTELLVLLRAGQCDGGPANGLH